MTTTHDLLKSISLLQKNKNTFEGTSKSVGSENVFGGQALAQALYAAQKTVAGSRFCHSVHAYFLLPGDLEKPITYKVQRIRDGNSFTTRYVTAIQDKSIIFVAACSFQIEEPGYEFQEKVPEAPAPETLLSWEEIYDQTRNFLPESVSGFLGISRPISFKPAVIYNPFEKKDLPPKQQTWFRFKEVNPEMSAADFRQILAYTSDYNILLTAIQPHASRANFSNTRFASLDHAMWFHRIPEDFSDWFLYDTEVISTSNARAMTRGKIYCRQGNLIASVAQEGLMRPQ